MQRGFDKDRLVANDLCFHIVRQRRHQFCQTLLDGVSDRHGVLSGLLRNHQSDRRLTIQARFGALLFRPVFDIPDVADLHCVRSLGGHHQVVELRRIRNASHRAHGELALACFNPTARQFHVLQFYRIGHVSRRNIEGAHLVRIDPDFHFTQPAADDFHVADSIDRFDHALDLLVGNVGDLAQAARG